MSCVGRLEKNDDAIWNGFFIALEIILEYKRRLGNNDKRQEEQRPTPGTSKRRTEQTGKALSQRGGKAFNIFMHGLLTEFLLTSP